LFVFRRKKANQNKQRILNPTGHLWRTRFVPFCSHQKQPNPKRRAREFCALQWRTYSWKARLDFRRNAYQSAQPTSPTSATSSVQLCSVPCCSTPEHHIHHHPLIMSASTLVWLNFQPCDTNLNVMKFRLLPLHL